MQNYDEIITAIIGSYENIEPKFYNPQVATFLNFVNLYFYEEWNDFFF